MGPENPGSVERQAGRQEDTTHVQSPNFCISTENSHRLVPNRDKKAGSVHCYGSEEQINATPKCSLRSFDDLAKNMASRCFSSTSAALCLCAYSTSLRGTLHHDKYGLKGNTVKLVQLCPSNKTDTFPLCSELALRPHCFVCIIIYTYKQRVPYQISRGILLIRSKVPRSAKSRLI